MAYQQQQPLDQNFLWNIFQKVDSDKSGSITAVELQQALANGTWKPFNPETIRLMIGMFDKDKNGTITFQEFGALWKYVTDWQQCFKNFDRDNSANIDKNELKQALTSFGYRLSDKFYDILVKKFDRTNSNNIKFDDFIQCCVVLQAGISYINLTYGWKKTITGVFQQYDTNGSGWINIQYEQFLHAGFALKF